ncbi:MAG: DUF4827 domain-containing protein [Prevotellaceae bacterium]|nr:DUF4827 domain-containing protein [Candidatus Minthosoma caballi]
MKKLFLYMLTTAVVGISLIMAVSCNDGETYADQKNKEKKAISRFLSENGFGGPIKVISESQFYAQDSTTNVAKNEFVLFNEDGIYMQIVSKGEGQTMIEMAKETRDSTVSKVLLCRFIEYDIENADTTNSNIYAQSIVDKMLCKYIHYSRKYNATFTEGMMYRQLASNSGSAPVPEGWLKPLDFIRLSRDPGKVAKVRIIVPHSSGTMTASQYVLPYYYEVSYQLGK